MKSESTQVSCMGIYHLFQFTVHTVVLVVPVTTHQIDPICTWKPYNCSESMHGRVLPSSFIHSKVLQPPQTKLITWSFPYVHTRKHWRKWSTNGVSIIMLNKISCTDFLWDKNIALCGTFKSTVWRVQWFSYSSSLLNLQKNSTAKQMENEERHNTTKQKRT